MTASLPLAIALVFGVTAAQAQIVDRYNITPQEQADCQADATWLCSAVYPDEDKLIDCMKAHWNRLSPRCLKTLTAGLARRHM